MKLEDIPLILKFKKDNPWIYLWLYRLGEYIGLFVIVAISGILITNWYHVAPTNIDNALYFLSAMVQAQAAIISLVITLTLIAIQMTAASYTPRVVDVMKKNPDMWFLLIIYIEAISMGFYALKEVAGPEDQHLVSLIFILGIYTFLTLLLYMYNTINLLRPDEVVKMLVADINAGNIQQTKDAEDIMQPVFDVVHASISHFDITTTRAGLNQLEACVIDLLRTSNEIDRYSIVDHFCNHIERSTVVTFQNDDEGMIIEIILVLGNLGNQVADLGPEKDNLGLVDAAQRIVLTLRKVGVHAADKEWRRATYLMSQVLHYIGLHAANSGLDVGTMEVAHAIKEVSIHAIDREIVPEISVVPGFLSDIGTYAMNKGFERATMRLVGALEEIGIHAADKGMAEMTRQVVLSLDTFGTQAVNKGLDDAPFIVVETLRQVGIHAADKRLEGVTISTAKALQDISEHVVDTELKGDMIRELSDALGEIGEHAVNKRLENGTIHVVNALVKIADRTSDNGLEVDTCLIVNILVKMGERSPRMGLRKATDHIAEGLVKIGERAARNGLWAGISVTVGEDYAVLAARESAHMLLIKPFTSYSSEWENLDK